MGKRLAWRVSLNTSMDEERLDSFNERHNNGMHPTRNSAAPIIKGSGGRVMPDVRRFNLGVTRFFRR
jgi:hypothetical protein